MSFIKDNEKDRCSSRVELRNTWQQRNSLVKRRKAMVLIGMRPAVVKKLDDWQTLRKRQRERVERSMLINRNINLPTLLLTLFFDYPRSWGTLVREHKSQIPRRSRARSRQGRKACVTRLSALNENNLKRSTLERHIPRLPTNIVVKIDNDLDDRWAAFASLSLSTPICWNGFAEEVETNSCHAPLEQWNKK